jgi:hypothetical protein
MHPTKGINVRRWSRFGAGLPVREFLNVPDELPPCRSDGRPPIVRKLAPVAPLEIAAHRLGRLRHPLGPALFEAYSQAGDNPELELDLPDLGDDIGSAAFICPTPLLPPASPQAQADF